MQQSTNDKNKLHGTDLSLNEDYSRITSLDYVDPDGQDLHSRSIMVEDKKVQKMNINEHLVDEKDPNLVHSMEYSEFGTDSEAALKLRGQSDTEKSPLIQSPPVIIKNADGNAYGLSGQGDSNLIEQPSDKKIINYRSGGKRNSLMPVSRGLDEKDEDMEQTGGFEDAKLKKPELSMLDGRQGVDPEADILGQDDKANLRIGDNSSSSGSYCDESSMLESIRNQMSEIEKEHKEQRELMNSIMMIP